MNNIDFNQLRDRAYQCACDHGFHQLELSNEHFLMLVITELSEAVEADRKGWCAHPEPFLSIVNLRATISDEKWREVFETYVKNSVEDELADAVIRLLDLAGLRGIEIDLYPKSVDVNAKDFKGKTFTECIYHICRLVIFPQRCVDSLTTMYFGINHLIASILGLAKNLDIDLLWHIEQKMKYNQLREQKHEKNY